MVSITADFGEQYMAKRQNNSDLPSWVVTLLTTSTPILLIFGAVTVSMLYDGIQESLKSINTSMTAINITLKAQGESLARIEEKFKYLDLRVERLEKPHYESKARASGFKDPKVFPTSLEAQEKFESKPIDSGNEQVLTRYTVLSYNPTNELLTIRVDTIIRSSDGKERFGNNYGNTISFRVKPGEKAIVPPMFAERPHPTIFIEVLERSSPNRAILAIGEKVKSGDKSS